MPPDPIKVPTVPIAVSSSSSSTASTSPSSSSSAPGSTSPSSNTLPKKFKVETSFNGEKFADEYFSDEVSIPYGSLTMERGARESKVEQSKEADDGDALLLKLDFPNGCRYALRLSNVSLKPHSGWSLLDSLEGTRERWAEVRSSKHESSDEDEDLPETDQKTQQESDGPYLWVCCDRCLEWRKFVGLADSSMLPEKWYCEMNPDPNYRRCSKKKIFASKYPTYEHSEDVCSVCRNGGAPEIPVTKFHRPERASSRLRERDREGDKPDNAGFDPNDMLRPLVACAGPCRRSFHEKCVDFLEADDSTGEWYCQDCIVCKQICFHCRKERNDGADLVKCGIRKCGKSYHLECLELLPGMPGNHPGRKPPQVDSKAPKKKSAVSAALARFEQRRSAMEKTRNLSPTSNAIATPWHARAASSGAAITCPLHWCRTCGKQELGRKMVKCISCPVAYHLTTRCRPRDSQLLSTTLICCRECQNPAISKPLEVNLTKCLFKPGSKKSSTKKRQLKILPQSQIKDGENDDNDDKAEKQAVKRPKLISE